MAPAADAAAPAMDEAGWFAGNAILAGQSELVRAMQGRAAAAAELALQRLALRGALVCGSPLPVATLDALTPAVFRAHVAAYTTLPATHVIVADAIATAPASHATGGSAAVVDAKVRRHIERFGRGVCGLSLHCSVMVLTARWRLGVGVGATDRVVADGRKAVGPWSTVQVVDPTWVERWCAGA